MQTRRASWLSRPLLVAFGLVLLLALGGFGYGLLATRSVSAAEIIANNRQRTAANADFGLHSYRGTLGMLRAGVLSRQATVTIQGQRSRAEVCELAQSTCTLYIETPDYEWQYDSTAQQARYTVLDSARQTNGIATGMFSGSSLDQVIASASIDAEVELNGTETVAGRPAYVLLIHTEHGMPDTLRVSVDQEYFIALRVVGLDSSGTELSRMEFTELEINPLVDAATFAFVPPAAATVTCQQSLTVYGSQQFEVDGQTVNQETISRPLDPASGQIVADPTIPCPDFGE